MKKYFRFLGSLIIVLIMSFAFLPQRTDACSGTISACDSDMDEYLDEASVNCEDGGSEIDWDWLDC